MGSMQLVLRKSCSSKELHFISKLQKNTKLPNMDEGLEDIQFWLAQVGMLFFNNAKSYIEMRLLYHPTRN